MQPPHTHFCLLPNSTAGAIVYIDLENVERRYFVAESFSAFVKRIVPSASPPCVDAGRRKGALAGLNLSPAMPLEQAD